MGGEAALLLDRVLQLAVHASACCSASASTPGTRPIRTASGSGYDDLLSATGLADAAELAGRFGIDIRDEAFWADSLDVVRGRIDRFTALVREFDAADDGR